MVHPFWLINSSLLGLCLYAFFFIYYMNVTVPPREEIEPLLYSKPKKEQQVSINIKHIYEHDLFGTYKKELPKQRTLEVVAPIPHPPEPQRPIIPEPPQPTFLQPLNIMLKGIVVVSSDEQKNRAIIMDNKNDQEAVYKVGDTVQDAQLIRIFSNKVVLLRTNGQQEVLYLREFDAKSDPTFAQIEDWGSSVRQIGNNIFEIYPVAFIKRVGNLPRFIELLGLTTAYQKGEPIGTRIGPVAAGSLGFVLGLRPEDIILSIEQTPATTTDYRLEIYNKIIASKPGDQISVKILRNKRMIELRYVIKQIEPEIISARPTQPEKPAEPGIKEQPIEEEMEFAPAPVEEYVPETSEFEEELFASMRQDMRNRETLNMLAHGKSPEER